MKVCPFCSEKIQDDATKCRYCSEWLKKEETSNIEMSSVRFPKIWIGYIVALVILLLGIFKGIMSSEIAFAPFIILGALVSIGGTVYWYICLYKLHKMILIMANDQYPISAGRAVGFNFIPIYNIYWMFKWPSEVINFVNFRNPQRKYNPWLPGILFFISGFLIYLDASIWFFIDFAVLSLLIKRLNESIAVEPKTVPFRSQAKAMPAGAIVGLVCIPFIAVLGLLAAIAIPNFIAARETAQRNACINNMRMIDAAEHQWAIEKRKSGFDRPSATEIATYIRGGFPICPAEGTYTIGTVDELPSCTIHGELPKSY